MILVIDYNLKELKIWSFKESKKGLLSSFFIKDAEEAKDNDSLKRCIRSIAGKDRLKAFAFRILSGGDYFAKPAIVNSDFFGKFKKLTDLLPFYIPSMLGMIKRFKDTFKDTPVLTFFETSFFLNLPDEEKYYALPFEYYKNSRIKKFGFHGLFHEANAGIIAQGSKVISIVFDRQTTVCAVYNKRPLSISLGYTPLEGIMSRRACGDLDPGIAFYLMNIHNFSIYEIDEILKNESGFVGLTGYDIDLKDMFKLLGKDPRVDLAFDVYKAQILKHIGEGISVMGGIDNIIFSGDNVGIFTPIIYNILKSISFLGINIEELPWASDKALGSITSKESKIRSFVNRVSLPAIIFHETEVLLRKY
jgi:acetate kinase